jgi:O-6-methylguanine DNA methyltransferase
MTFFDNVYEIVLNIPKGKVATYGQIAKLAGNPQAARAVGMCMKKNPNAPIVPCHRVVGSDGRLTGYSVGKGILTKQDILRKEGVRFLGTNVDLNVSLWDGKIS